MTILHVGQVFEDFLGSKKVRVLNILFEFVSIASRLLIVSRVRHILYGDSPLIQNKEYILILKPNFSLERIKCFKVTYCG